MRQKQKVLAPRPRPPLWARWLAMATLAAVALPVLSVPETSPSARREPVPMEASTGRDPAAIAQPPGGLVNSAPNVGRLEGEFSVSDDGAANFALPLWMPRGRGNVAPALTLSYSSRDGEGPFGVGWSLGGLSTIEWCPRTFAQDGFSDGLHSDGTSALCLGDNRLLPVSAPFSPIREYRTERANFARIVGYETHDNVPDFFRVWTKDGRILTFGEALDSRLRAYQLKQSADWRNPSMARGSRVTVAWGLNRIEDRNGNAATVEYRQAEGSERDLWGGHMLPASVSYAPNRRVEFHYESRTDAIDRFTHGGVHTRIAVRASAIEMWAGPENENAELLRSYRLGYQNRSVTGRSLLDTVLECDHNGACKLPLRFEWSQGRYEFKEIRVAGNLGTKDGWRIQIGDVNGDGRDDLIHRNDGKEFPAKTWVRRSVSNTFAPPQSSLPDLVGYDHNTAEPYMRIVDVDADGRTELAALVLDDPHGPIGTNWRWKLFGANGTGFVPATDGGIGDALVPNQGNSHQAYFADLNGDGLTDFLEVKVAFPPVAGAQWHYRLNAGSTGPERFPDRVQTAISRPASGPDNYVMDTDGDGRAEILTRGALPGSRWRSWGLSANGTAETQVQNLNTSDSVFGDLFDSDALFGDVNGDGLDDKIRLSSLSHGRQALNVLINSGTGFFEARPTVLNQHGGHPIEPGDLRIVDFNNDGRDDVLTMVTNQVTGSSDEIHRVKLHVWTGGRFASRTLPFELSCDHECNWSGTQPLDFDADGLVDLVHFAPGNDGLRLFHHRGGVPDQLVRIGDSRLLGGALQATETRVEINYTNLANRAVHTPGESCTYPLVCPASGGSVVAWHRFPNGVGKFAAGWDRYDHRYRAARIDLQGRGWLGFAEHGVIRNDTNQLTVTEFDNTTRVVAATTEHPNVAVYPYAGVPKAVTTNIFNDPSNNGVTYRRSITYGNVMQRYADGSFLVEQRRITLREEEREDFDAVWQALRRSTTETFYDEYGNKDLVVSITEGGRKLTEDIDYSNASLGLPSRTLITGCTASFVCEARETTFDYDDHGNLTVMVVEPNNPTLKLTTTTAYGEFGVVTSVTRADDAGHIRADSYEYNADQLHPTAVVNAMEHRTLVEIHSGLGVPLRTTDPNGVLTTMRYDWFGRPREINYADGNFEHVEHADRSVTTAVAGGGSTRVVFDQLGREIERRVSSFDGSGATAYTGYDTLGRIDRVSHPALSSLLSEAQYTRFGYDRRGRVTSVTAPDGAQERYEYQGRETHTYDAKGAHSYTTETMDGEVEVRYEDDPNSADWLRVRFEYGSFGELINMVAPDDTVQTMHFDPLGRRDRLQDPSSGTTATTYNAFGEAVTVTDAENRATTFEYDPLGRVKKATSPDGTATNTWDTADHGLGKLATASSADGVSIDYAYDEFGKNATTTWTIEGTGYEFQYGYDEIGRLTCLRYPMIPSAADRLSVGYFYNPRGFVTQVTDGCEVGSQPYWAAEFRNGAGQLEIERFGNGVVTTRTYQPDTGLLDRIHTTGPGTIGQLGDISYDYDVNRNVTKRYDHAHQRAEFYHYDVLNRLDGWSVQTDPGPSVSTTYTYSPSGDLNTETVQSANQPGKSTTYQYGQDGAPPHALTALNDQKYGYDHAGQQTRGPDRTVQYNTLGLPAVLDWGIGQGQVRHTTFAYDPDGARVIKRDDVQTNITVAGLFERRTPAGTDRSQIHNLHNIVVGGRVIAQVNGVQSVSGGPVIASRVTYLHTDLQGSTVALTNSDGEPSNEDSWLRVQFYEPFGRRINAQNEPVGGDSKRDGPRQGYTGHDHDVEYGLINMAGRVYDPEARRFLTPDPILQNPFFTQGHNRYTYVWNNPSTLIDPTGWQACDPDNASCSPELDWEFGSSGGSDGGDMSEDYLYGSNVITPDGIDDDVAWPEDTTAEQLAGTGLLADSDPDLMSADEILGEYERLVARLDAEEYEAEARALAIDEDRLNRKIWLMMGGALLLATGVGAAVELGLIGGGVGGTAVGAEVGVAAAAAGRGGPEAWTRVQRWMSRAEAVQWVGRSSMPQPLPLNLGYSVSTLGAARASAAAKEVLVEFEVLTHALNQGGRIDWFTIYNKGILVPIRGVLMR